MRWQNLKPHIPYKGKLPLAQQSKILWSMVKFYCTGSLWAAVVPLALAATPFFTRIAEVSLREVDQGLIEAAQAMGCNRKQIVWHVLLPEALPDILAGFTVTLVTMINSSTISGAIGAGGLGDIAYRYGYQRFDMQIMLAVIVVLIQATGDTLANQLDKRKI